MKKILTVILAFIMVCSSAVVPFAQESGDYEGGVFECTIDFASLCASGASEVTDEHFTGIGVANLNPSKGGWYCQAASNSGFSIAVNGEASSEVYIETYVNLIWTSNLKITAVSDDGEITEEIIADTDSGRLLDDEGNVLATYSNTGADHMHKIGILAGSDNDEALVYLDGVIAGTVGWTVDSLGKVDFTFGKTVEADLRPWVYNVTVTSDSSKFPEQPEVNPDDGETPGSDDDKPENTKFTYINDFSSSLSDEYMTSTKNLQMTSSGVVKYGVGGNWGNMVVSNLPELGSRFYTKFDLYNQASAYFKLIAANSDSTSAYIVFQNGVNTVSTSSGQSYEYDSSVMNGKFAAVEVIFDSENSKAALYITDSDGARTLIADDMNIDTSNLASLTYQVEARTGGMEPFFDNLIISNEISDESVDEVFDCYIDYASLAASGNQTVDDEHFTVLGEAALRSDKGGLYCKAENNSGFSIYIGGKNSGWIYVEAKVDMIWTSNLTIKAESADGSIAEKIIGDTDSGILKDDDGQELAAYSNTGASHVHTIGILANADEDKAYVYFDGAYAGETQWLLDEVEKIDCTFSKTVPADLRPVAMTSLVTCNEEKFPALPGSSEDEVPDDPNPPEDIPEEPEILDAGAELLSFAIEGYAGKISGDNVTVTVKGDSLKNLRASFTVGTDVKVYVEDELQESGVTRNDFRSAVIYKLVAPNGEEREYAVKAKLKEKASSSGGGGGGGGSGYTGYQSGAVQALTPVVPNPYTEPPVVTPDPEGFTDLADAEWAREYIEALFAKGIVNGTGEGTFEPNRSITREEFVKLLVLALGLETASGETAFDDVDAGEWYAPYVAAAAGAQLIKGESENTFGISHFITRQQMVTMIYRAYGDRVPSKVREFKDFEDADKVDDYALEAFISLYCAGVIDGVSGSMLAPEQNATRAQAAKLIYDLVENIK